MGLESGTYINDLQPVNPTSTDAVSQGDDHLRFIKQVLQNTFVNATRQYQIPTTRVVTATGTLLKSDGNGIVYVSTAGGAVVLTMPSLVALDAGWSTQIIKTTGDVNPMFIVPSTGTISSAGYSVARARRCIPHRRFAVVWDGANWYCERSGNLPIGSLIDFYGAALPAGFEWPSGQTLASASTNYPEYFGFYGSGATPDTRGCALVALDNLGGTAAGRLGSIINGTILGSLGGGETVGLVATQIPNLSVSVSGTISGSGTFYPAGNSGLNFPTSTAGFTYVNYNAPSGGVYTSAITSGVAINSTNNVSGSVSGSCSATGTASGSGSGTGGIHSNLQPSVVVSRILVVE